jgi:hypothetical protein
LLGFFRILMCPVFTGLALLELLVPIYWLSDRLVQRHHGKVISFQYQDHASQSRCCVLHVQKMSCLQVFEAVLSRELGPTRPVVPISAAERDRLQELLVKHRDNLHGQSDFYNKIQKEMQAHNVPSSVKVLLWVFTPPPDTDPLWKVRYSV